MSSFAGWASLLLLALPSIARGVEISNADPRRDVDGNVLSAGEGNLIELIRKAGPLIGEIQVADVPGRMEPGTGEVNWPAVARALQDSGYTGVVGLESFASGDDVVAVEAFRAAFSA